MTNPRPLSAAAFWLVLLACAVWASPVCAQQGGGARFMRECAQWVAKKGYSTDYIEQRTGQRPSGNTASQWRSNLDPKDAQPGDVVFLRVDSGGGEGQRAEVVDEVLRDATGAVSGFRTSSMNVGKLVEPDCHITENFGKAVTRQVSLDRVARAWRADARN